MIMPDKLLIPLVYMGITFTEIPNETTLFYELGNCTCECPGCHSPELWVGSGASKNATVKEILDIYDAHKEFITAVLFMGGNRNGIDFKKFLEEVVKPIHYDVPVGIYLGDFNANDFTMAAKYCRWIKVGKYNQALGGLDSKLTNQVFCEVQNYKFIRE